MNKETDLTDMLFALLEWESYMGGFDSPVWDRAKSLANAIKQDDNWSTHVPE